MKSESSFERSEWERKKSLLPISWEESASFEYAGTYSDRRKAAWIHDKRLAPILSLEKSRSPKKVIHHRAYHSPIQTLCLSLLGYWIVGFFGVAVLLCEKTLLPHCSTEKGSFGHSESFSYTGRLPNSLFSNTVEIGFRACTRLRYF